MTVRDLIKELEKCNLDAQVIFYDGGCGYDVANVTEDGVVVELASR